MSARRGRYRCGTENCATPCDPGPWCSAFTWPVVLTIRETCDGCGAKAPSAPEPGALPKGWIIVYNPLFGQPWQACACSHACVSAKRLRAVAKLHAYANAVVH
jgi:hypothetical protein